MHNIMQKDLDLSIGTEQVPLKDSPFVSLISLLSILFQTLPYHELISNKKPS